MAGYPPAGAGVGGMGGDPAYGGEAGYAVPAGPRAGGYGPPGMAAAAGSSLKHMQTTTSMNIVFFAAACCIMGGAFISSIWYFFEFSFKGFVNNLNMMYMFMLGGVLAILDTPIFKTVKKVHDLKFFITKYASFVTRVTGKGICFVFLGCSLLSSMWHNENNAFMQFLAVLINGFVIFVGVAAIVIGGMKSQKLRQVQIKLGQGVLEQNYPHCAKKYPPSLGPLKSGLTPMEFNELTKGQGCPNWDDADLKLIFNTLCTVPAWRVQPGGNPADDQKLLEQDLKDWVYGGTVWL
eukprot:TRINITY_DN4948_c0_g4_i1.p1 TRINITY_DN4948_c0_g4~~TRINITY_DN4948_c0_g4_i1.p1  ORF type:complete len:344 (+),score=73.82 TRINITY_DN4948_c0_g4_i1:156-1034(+)